MQRILLLGQALFFYLGLAAQTGNIITGTVLDELEKLMVAASVSLLKAGDSTLVKIALTNKDGVYEFTDIKEGKYLVTYSSVGYENKWGGPYELVSVALKLDPVRLNVVAKGLGTVTVVSKRPFIETKIDKTVINVEASPTSAGATALEVLEKSPGITVDNDGVISLKGKSGVIVMMDGKPTHLSPTDLANLLRNLPASSLDQIELMTNPSSKFDASGNAGVINIKTKKGGKNDGFNGSVMVGATVSVFKQDGNVYFIPKSQNSLTFNYKKNKLNFFGNYNPNVFRGRNFQEIQRTKLDENMNVLGYNELVSRFRFGNENQTLKLGLDYFADKKNTFGVVVSGFDFAGHPVPTTITTSFDENHQVLSSLHSIADNKIRFRNLTSNINYRHLIDTAGRELTADLDYIIYDNTSRMLLSTDIYNASGQPVGERMLLQGYLPSDINIFSFKSDYVHPFKKGGRIEAGVKSSFVKNDNLVNYVRWYDNKWVPDARSNHFKYEENINAVYASANTQIKKWSFQGGLRLENTISKGHQVTNDSSFKRNFTNLFPSAFISYDITKSNQVKVSYSRRITRPNYQDLNPFIYFLDSLSYRKGNPFLLPQFTDNFELSHSFKNKFITTLNYSNTSDVISMILKPDGNLVYLTSENVSKFRNIGISITAPVTITKWWTTNMFTNIFYNHYKGLYESRPLDISYTSFTVNMTQTFTIKQGFTAEMSGFYRARGVNQLNILEPMYVISFGAQKQVMKGKGTLRLNLRDPFALQQFKANLKYDIVDSGVQSRWDNRQITASFTYRFGKNGAQESARKRSNASQDEQNRVGQQN